MDQKLMMNQLYNVQFEWKWIVNETNFKNIKMKNGKNWKPFNCTVGKCIKKLNWTEGVWNMLAWWKFISVSIFWDLHVGVNDLYWLTALGGFCDCHNPFVPYLHVEQLQFQILNLGIHLFADTLAFPLVPFSIMSVLEITFFPSCKCFCSHGFCIQLIFFSYLLSLGNLKPPHIFYYSFRADEYKIDILSYNSYAS